MGAWRGHGNIMKDECDGDVSRRDIGFSPVTFRRSVSTGEHRPPLRPTTGVTFPT
jgi:hypothetical protein